MNSIILPILTLIIGTALGLISSLIASKYKQHNTITEKLLEYYFSARSEIVEVVGVLADLNVHDELDENERDKFRQKVASIYFRNYDFLPAPVYEALLTLHACLIDGKGRLFQVKDEKITPIPEKSYSTFIDKLTRYKNIKLYSKQAIQSKNERLRVNLAIKLQAQSVIRYLNKLVTTEDLINMTKNFRK